MPGVDLSVGGWYGWYFRPYGRAKMWRLIAPNGETFSPGEILEIRPLQLDVSYLKMRVNQLKAIARPSISPGDFQSLTHAVNVLQEFLGVFSSLGGYPVNVGRGSHTPLYAVETNQAVSNKGGSHAVTIPSAGVDQRPHTQLGPGKLVRNR